MSTCLAHASEAEKLTDFDTSRARETPSTVLLRLWRDIDSFLDEVFWFSRLQKAQ